MEERIIFNPYKPLVVRVNAQRGGVVAVITVTSPISLRVRHFDKNIYALFMSEQATFMRRLRLID